MIVINETITQLGEAAKLQVRLWENSEEFQIGIKRPMIVVVPGGGYSYTSDREADPVANAFAGMGFHTAILRYSVKPVCWPTQIQQLAASVAYIRRHADEWYVDPDKIVVMGFSAGGHLAASLAVHWHEEWLSEAVGATNEEIRPNFMVLAYAVLIAHDPTHLGTWKNLLGEDWESHWEDMSLDAFVSEQTPPCFLWCNGQDTTVPLESSMTFAAALRRSGVPFELHCYERGKHGASLCNELVRKKPETKFYQSVAMWTEQCRLWLKQQFDPDFV